MGSTLVCNSGRTYIQGEMLQQHHKLTLHKAKSGNDAFILKRVWPGTYNMNMQLAAELGDCRGLRMHIDYKQDENESILVYPYFRDTLLGLIKDDPNLHMLQRMKILRRVAEAIQELHMRDWLHIVGNVMWRNPEGQTGIGLTKASDIYSFGLVCIYALGGAPKLLISDYAALHKLGITLEQEILSRHFVYFGLPGANLFNLVRNEMWCRVLQRSFRVAEYMVKNAPELKFEVWAREAGAEALELIGAMVSVDPGARATMEWVLAHSRWSDLELLDE
ncbi:hypothetical protein J1614_009081 [Plenodomus biglobosus]|nr:hypothetical protein J1614_009081 [Plenodomus biglobosus]